VDEATRAAALELNVAGLPQRVAAEQLGVSRSAYRRAIGAAGVDARIDGQPALLNGALHREALPLTLVADLDDDGGAEDDTAEDDTAEDDTAEDEWSTRKALTVLVAVAILGLVAWLVYRRRAAEVD
jgi:hypothetical protein